ncbi:MAG: DUF4384 domain-containing protein [Chitinophagaceae bacterium]|nr:MAG: DUF4384 domain-containing protein [Chitinophagaceae bacterium]
MSTSTTTLHNPNFRHFAVFLPFIVLLFINMPLLAQRKGTGMKYNPPKLRGIPYKAKLTKASYGAMPVSASVEQYAPTAGDQGMYGTCVAFAAGYHLRTILHNKQQVETGKPLEKNRQVFSPSFIYEVLKTADDRNCDGGLDPQDAFDLMKESGVSTLSTLPYRCGAAVTEASISEARNFRITDYQILFEPDDTELLLNPTAEQASLKINATKKALSEGYPALIGFLVAESFYEVQTDVWRPKATDDGPTGQHGYHAMCVVGYDDTKYGGSFRVMNSWGTAWGDKGLVWIPYKNFADYTLVAIQGYVPKGVKPDESVRLKGDLRFQLNTGETMPVVPANNSREELAAYKMDKSYSSGTRFRFLVNTSTESFVYAFASDLGGKVNKLLPFADNMSPHIGSNSTIAFPGENKVVKMDANPGTDFMLVLYSKERLDADALLAQMNAMQGSFSSKIRAVLGAKLPDPGNIRYESSSAGFDARLVREGTIVPVMVEIEHN